MSVSVIHFLEVIQIEQEDRQWSSMPAGTLHLAVEKLDQVSPVVDAGERVEDRQPVNLLVVLGLVRDGSVASLDHRVVVVGVDVVGPVRSLAQVVLSGHAQQVLDAGTDVDHRIVLAGAVDVDHDGEVIDQPPIARLEVGQLRRQIATGLR